MLPGLRSGTSMTRCYIPVCHAATHQAAIYQSAMLPLTKLPYTSLPCCPSPELLYTSLPCCPSPELPYTSLPCCPGTSGAMPSSSSGPRRGCCCSSGATPPGGGASSASPSPFFVNISEHADGERRGPVSPIAASRRGLSDATLRLDPAPRCSAVGMPRKLVKKRWGNIFGQLANALLYALLTSADLFLATSRRAPTANAEGLDRIEGWRRKGLGEARL